MEKRIELTNAIGQVLQQVTHAPAQDIHIEGKPLRGGIEASGVTLVTVRYRNHSRRQQMFRLVAKHLTGRPAREAAVYQRIVAAYARDLAPQLLAVEGTGSGDILLLIEAVRRTTAWPWRSLEAGEELLARLADFHTAAAGATALVPEWDYEAELQAVAELTRTTLEQCRSDPDLAVLARDLPALDRLVRALPAHRKQLLSERPFGSRPIHGDLHPGNVMLSRRGGQDTPILLDWGRARVSSPLEDVSSWLQSVSYWEPEGRRRHDTLLAAYLSALGMDRRLTDSLRAAYWMAAASNALSGALLHHLSIARNCGRSSPQRTAATKAARDALRVVRRADAWWS
ncbi:aminoglycoside phosphotransferase family protein [Microvirga sp. BSC39]|uniref:aminoglycoside phosphotransferase family protein n=1 Tax=Microvirga sp. BSC39 TaxID=1549810 RepID=UPI00068B11CB|nr:aminoglycoside phosphotransferase family protein [Microvirga sp. BSC39]